MDIVVVKASSPDERDRMWVTRSDGSTDQVPINVVHDLPHLVVESAFDLKFGFWGLIDAGGFAREIHASQAREPKRAKQGRHGVMSGKPQQSWIERMEAADPMLAEHSDEVIAAKALTNAFRDYGDMSLPAVRSRLDAAAAYSAIARSKLEGVTDATVERVLSELDRAAREWQAVPPGGRIELHWPRGA